jgi:hypothetical protein
LDAEFTKLNPRRSVVHIDLQGGPFELRAQIVKVRANALHRFESIGSLSPKRDG